MSHIKNVEALEKLLSICTGLGAKYNPVRPKLQLSNMTAVLSKAQEALRDERAARINYNNVINSRRTTFMEIRPMASRIINLLAASGAGTFTMEDAKAFNQRTYGKSSKLRKPVSSEAAEAVKTTRPAREVSFTKMLDNFEQLIRTAAADPGYQPNEADLKVEYLNERLAKMKASHFAAMEAKNSWTNGMISRNQVLYDTDTAVYNTGKDVRRYVKAVFGAGAREFRQLKDVKFSKP